MRSMPRKQNDFHNEEGKENTQSRLTAVLKQLNAMINNVDEESAFQDKFQTTEQKYRDSKISQLLKHYVNAYQNKTESQVRYRRV